MRALVLILLVAACKDGSDPVPQVPDTAIVVDTPPDTSTACLLPGGNPANCFDQNTCEPTEDVDFLNGCTDGSCVGFDNTARLPHYNGGNLPALGTAL